MKRTQIIGLTGPRGVGKTTVASILASHAHFTSLAFGDLLRNQICTAFNVDISLFVDRALKDYPSKALALQCCLALEFNAAVIVHLRATYGDDSLIERLAEPRTPREIMKLWAEQYRKPIYGEQYFSRAIVNRIHVDHSKYLTRHVIHDVRFDAEAAAIRSMGGVIWQVTRPGIEVDITDLTETDGSQYQPDVVIENRYDFKHLQALVMSQWLLAETKGMGWKEIATMGVVAVNTMAAPA